jgi:hypothetical protein
VKILSGVTRATAHFFAAPSILSRIPVAVNEFFRRRAYQSAEGKKAKSKFLLRLHWNHNNNIIYNLIIRKNYLIKIITLRLFMFQSSIYANYNYMKNSLDDDGA